MRYEAPDTLDAALGLLAEAGADARVLAGGTDLLIQMRAGRRRPGLLVDLKGIAELRTIVADDGGWRIGAAVSCMELIEHEAFATDLARPDRRREIDRLGPGEGPRHDGRQSVQWLAGGRQRSGADRRGRDRQHRRSQGPARTAGRAGRHRARQDIAGPRRDRRGVPAEAARAAFRRRLSALHAANRNGHRRGRRRRQPDAGCERRVPRRRG